MITACCVVLRHQPAPKSIIVFFAEAVGFPHTVAFAGFPGFEARGVTFLDLDFPDDVLLGTAYSCVYPPGLCNFSDFLNTSERSALPVMIAKPFVQIAQ